MSGMEICFLLVYGSQKIVITSDVTLSKSSSSVLLILPHLDHLGSKPIFHSLLQSSCILLSPFLKCFLPNMWLLLLSYYLLLSQMILSDIIIESWHLNMRETLAHFFQTGPVLYKSIQYFSVH